MLFLQLANYLTIYSSLKQTELHAQKDFIRTVIKKLPLPTSVNAEPEMVATTVTLTKPARYKSFPTNTLKPDCYGEVAEF